MTEPIRPVQSDYIRELQRLHDAHVAALKGGDPEVLEAAIDDLAHFLRMGNAGRLAEYFASRQTEE